MHGFEGVGLKVEQLSLELSEGFRVLGLEPLGVVMSGTWDCCWGSQG